MGVSISDSSRTCVSRASPHTPSATTDGIDDGNEDTDDASDDESDDGDERDASPKRVSAASASARRIAFARPRVVRQLPSIRIGDVMLKSIGT